jgi:hypothetical protein
VPYGVRLTTMSPRQQQPKIPLDHILPPELLFKPLRKWDTTALSTQLNRRFRKSLHDPANKKNILEMIVMICNC